MSDAIIGFQLAIIISVLIANSNSKEARDIVIGLWVLETFIFVWFMSPLMFLQFATITIMYYLTDEFWKEVIIDMSITFFRFILGIAFLIGLIYWGYNAFINKTDTHYQTLTPEEKCLENENLWEYNEKNYQWECTQLFALHIIANPKSAKIQIMNIKPKYYNGIKLKKGKYSIRVSQRGYYTENFYINFNSDSSYTSNLIKKN